MTRTDAADPPDGDQDSWPDAMHVSFGAAQDDEVLTLWCVECGVWVQGGGHPQCAGSGEPADGIEYCIECRADRPFTWMPPGADDNPDWLRLCQDCGYAQEPLSDLPVPRDKNSGGRRRSSPAGRSAATAGGGAGPACRDQRRHRIAVKLRVSGQ